MLRSWNMRVLLVLSSLSYCSQSCAQQERECKTSLFLEASLDSILIKKDTAIMRPKHSGFVDYAAARRIYYVLKPPGDAYKIVSFTVITENNEYINEAPCSGDTVNGIALRLLAQRSNDKPVYFTCIRVRHTSGSIYILKDLAVNLPRTSIYQ